MLGAQTEIESHHGEHLRLCISCALCKQQHVEESNGGDIRLNCEQCGFELKASMPKNPDIVVGPGGHRMIAIEAQAVMDCGSDHDHSYQQENPAIAVDSKSMGIAIDVVAPPT